MNKLVTYSHLATIKNNAGLEGKSIGFKSGCFDLIHIAHVEMLKRCKQYCDVLIVGIGSDKTCANRSSKLIFDEVNRANVIAALSFVDYVVIETEDVIGNVDHAELLKLLRPDLFFIDSADSYSDIKIAIGKTCGATPIVLQSIKINNFGEIYEPHSSNLKKHL